MLKFLSKLFGIKSSKPVPPPQPKRLQLKDVKVGQIIRIEWDMIKGGIGSLVCLNNDPLTRKILLQVKWGNYREVNCAQLQQLVLDYNDEKLKNFHLLNQQVVVETSKPDEPVDDTDIAAIQKKLNEALDNEEYELARELQNKIDKLVDKK
jgi:hypothetical protein